MSYNTLRLYFSFRSPYSYLGLYRFSHISHTIGCDYRLLPLVPSKEFTQQAVQSDHKLSYIREDLSRTFTAYGLEFKLPEPFDLDWIIPHAAFVYANSEGKGIEFALMAYYCRFCEGANLSRQEVLERIADDCGLDADSIIKAHTDRDVQKTLLHCRKYMEEDAVFGVPTFVYNGKKFWGNDRLDWLLREIYSAQGKIVPNLTEDILLRVF